MQQNLPLPLGTYKLNAKKYFLTRVCSAICFALIVALVPYAKIKAVFGVSATIGLVIVIAVLTITYCGFALLYYLNFKAELNDGILKITSGFFGKSTSEYNLAEFSVTTHKGVLDKLCFSTSVVVELKVDESKCQSNKRTFFV